MMQDNIDLSSYTPEQLKQMIKQASELVKAQEPVKKRVPKKLPKILKQPQIDKYLTAINIDTNQGIRQMAIISVFLRAGLRLNELCNLSKSDVDLTEGDIYVQEGKCSLDRHVPIGDNLKQALQAWEAIRLESNWYFCNRKGGRLHDRNVREMCYEIGARARVYIQDGRQRTKVHPHNFRHTFATTLLNLNYNIREVQHLLGHMNIQTTTIYTEICDVDLRKKVKETEWL
jgi:site-specific recombinase XerC